MSTNFLLSHAAKLSDFAAETRQRSKAAPEDFWLSIAAQNQEDAAADAAQELAIAQAMEAGRVVDFRFIGPKANGSLPLDSFLSIFSPLSKALRQAAHRLRFGRDDARVAGQIASQLNLKVAGLAPGSTHVYLSGNTEPDLTGESLLDLTLIQLFRVLNARNDDFYDAVDAIGSRAATNLREVMKAIDHSGFASEFTWSSKKETYFWEGLPDEMVRIGTLLDGLSEPEEYEETIAGVVAQIADTGKISIRTGEGKISVRFPLSLTSEAQRLSIATAAEVRVITSKYWDAVRHDYIYKRNLLAVLRDNLPI